jgi:hypothetical protein
VSIGGVFMVENVFLDESKMPSDQSLKTSFGESYKNYIDVMNIADSFFKDWNFSKRSGWMLKVHNKKKALFYVIPKEKEFTISMAIKDNERKILIKDSDLEIINEKLLSAKKYREGFAIKFTNNDKNYEIYELLIKKLVQLRK